MNDDYKLIGLPDIFIQLTGLFIALPAKENGEIT
jgi:hypothetical protein